MGIILREAAKRPSLFQNGKFCDLPSGVQEITSGLISVGKVGVNQAVAAMTGNQLFNLINKMDRIWRSDVSTPISDMVTEGLDAAIAEVRIISQVAQSGAEFQGILSAGQALDIWDLRPKDVGGVFLNGAGAVALGGLYGGVSGTVYDWAQPVVAGVASTIIPAQTSSGVSPYGGLVIFGGIEKTYTPKIESVQFFLQGLNNVVTAQPCNMTQKRTFGEDNDLSVFWLEKPIMILNGELFRVDIMPKVSGTTNFELIGMMVGQVQAKVF